MKKLSILLFALLLFTVPVFYHPLLFFPDQAKWALMALLLPLAFLCGPALAAWRSGGRFFLPEPRLPLIGLAAISGISVLWAASPWLWADSWGNLLLGLGVATISSWAVRQRIQKGEESWPWLAGPLLAAGLATAAVGLLQSTGLDPLGHSFDTRGALVSTFGNTNHAGEFLAPVAVIAFCLAVSQRGFGGHLGMVGLFLIVADLSASGVRAVCIACGAGLLIASWLLWRGMTPKQRALLLAPWIAAVAGFAAPKFVLAGDPARTESTRQTDTIEVRKKVYAATLRMIADRPLLGFGEGNFEAAFPLYRDPEEIEISSHHRKDPAESMVEEPHNDYLLFLAELGLAGAGLVAWLGWRVLRKGKSASRSLGASMAFAGIAAIGVNALFRSPFTNPSSSVVFWTLLGLLAVETEMGSPSPAKRGKWLSAIALAVLALLAWKGVHGLRGEILLAQGQRESAAHEDPGDPKKWEILGLEHRIAQDSQGARQAYDRLLFLNPNHFNGRLQRALVALDLGDASAARADLDAASRLDANNPRLLLARALLAFREGDDLDAIGALRRSIERGGDADSMRQFGIEVEKAGNAERALKYYQAYAETRPEDADVWMAMGQIFRNRGDEAESRKDFARAHRLYGIEHLRAQKPSDAERQFRLYRKFSPPDDPAPDLYLAAAALAKGDRPAAEGALRESASLGATQKDLFAPGLESLAADPALRAILPHPK